MALLRSLRVTSQPTRLTTADTRSAGLPYEDLAKYGGADRNRTGGLMNAIHALCQLSYSPSYTNYRHEYKK